MSIIFVTIGDITKKVPVDAIATLINSGGAWYGGLDGAIMRVAGDQYHATALAVLNSTGLQNGQAVVAKEKTPHKGSFKDVVFVVDDLLSPLGDLVYTALQSANDQGYNSVAFPLMRTGVMLGAVEPDVEAVVQQMKAGINRFRATVPTSRMNINIVVYSNGEAVDLLIEDGSVILI
ncbi:macro domain-containing protein [Candidatus Collierbacteria bacterium]|nr:macro domain-containing protein [Candidatus Collierbacteria bacterium]